MGNYEFRSYDPEFKQGLLLLQSHFWGANDSRNSAYFEWKYEKNPYMEPCIVMALDGRQVVAMLGVYGAQWEAGKNYKPTICPCAADAIVHPAHRMRGLFKQMMNALFSELLARGHEHIFAMSAGTMSYPGFLSTGWKSIAPVETLHRRERHYVRKSLRKVHSTLSRETTIDPFSNLDQKGAGNESIVAKQSRPIEMAALANTLPESARVRHTRDSVYFQWRFANPFSRYRFIYSGADSIDGYLVLQTAADGKRATATIVDWDACDEAVRTRLLQAVVANGGFDDLFAWSASWTGNSKDILRNFGFLPANTRATNRDSPVLVRPLQKLNEAESWRLNGRLLTDPNSWDLRWLYSDHCR